MTHFDIQPQVTFCEYWKVCDSNIGWWSRIIKGLNKLYITKTMIPMQTYNIGHFVLAYFLLYSTETMLASTTNLGSCPFFSNQKVRAKQDKIYIFLIHVHVSNQHNLLLLYVAVQKLCSKWKANEYTCKSFSHKKENFPIYHT